ncbi:nuclear protein MDM1 isoform X2 [Antennarius striatus]|uniref:nuclear protein MDM1 isoform X2 n=1 Tax=Antennarius striatus TaxID=241820 RepID=UPI0035B0CD79
MTVRFRGQSEYQRSYGPPRSRSAPPQRCVTLAGLHSRHACGSPAPRTGTGSKPSTSPGAQAECGPRPDPGPPAQMLPDPEPRTEPGSDCVPGPAEPAKPRPSRADSQPQLGRPVTVSAVGQQPPANGVRRALRWRAGPRSEGQRSEYDRQFGWRDPLTAASPVLAAEQTIRKRRRESEKKPRPQRDVPAPQKCTSTPPSQVQPRHRIQEEGGATDGHTPQVVLLRRAASSHRRRAWGTNFSREHLSQLLSEHNALWEEPTDSATPTPSHTHPLSDGRTSCVDALDLLREEGRLPTPRLKMLTPVQRTHHDLTTPATGGALLVGRMRSSDSSSKQTCGSAISMAAGAEPAFDVPPTPKEAWPDCNPILLPDPDSSPELQLAISDPPEATGMRQRPAPPVAPPPRCIHGSLRHPDFQHNGELGVRLWGRGCSGGGCGSDEDDRLSVMSWRSAASCSLASAVLERAQKRREEFWGKR